MEDLKKSFLVRGGNIVGAVGDKNFSTAPIGVIQAFSGNTIPYGYLLADGASYPTAEYPDLYAVIGNTYGGDSTNFNVPNLVDKFIQGSTTSGTEKEAGLPNITGTVGVLRAANGAFYRSNSDVVVKAQNSTSTGSEIALNGDNTQNDFDASKGETKTDGTLKTDDEAHVYGNSDTVQPPALTMIYIIKAFHTNEGVDSTNEVSDPIIEYVDNYVNNLNSYSTEETLTGGKWIDGKPIYRKCFSGSWTIPNSTWSDIVTVPNVERLIRTEMIGDKKKWDGYWEIDTNNSVRFYTPNGTTFNLCILEYTKTTD